MTPAGGILWDCISLVDDATVAAVQTLGGVTRHRHLAPALLLARWSSGAGRSGGVPVYLNAADREWVMRDDPRSALLGRRRRWRSRRA